MPLGAGEILVIFVLVLVLFGPDKLPELARGIGKGIREIRKVTSEFQNQINVLTDDDDRRPTARNAPRTPARPIPSSSESRQSRPVERAPEDESSRDIS